MFAVENNLKIDEGKFGEDYANVKFGNILRNDYLNKFVFD